MALYEQTEEQRLRAFRDAGVAPIDGNPNLESIFGKPPQQVNGHFELGNINSSNLSSSPTPNFQTYHEPAPYNVAGLTPDMTLTQPEQQAQGQFDALTELNKQLLGESSYRAEQDKAQGIPELQKTQNELSARLKTLQNEALAIPLQLQQESIGRGITAGGLQPIQTAALRNNAIQALSTNSLLEASRGNLTLAQDMAERAVAQKYDPIKEQIKVATANLDLILKSPAYSLAEKNRAQRQKDIQDQRARDIAKDELDKKEVYNMALTALQNGADQATVQRIQQASSPQDAMTIAGQFLQSPEAKLKLESAKLDLQLKELELARTRAGIGSKAPEVKTINGVDMQWNGTTSQWEPIGGTQEQSDKSISQIKFLRDTVQDANKLSYFAGQGLPGRWAGEILGQSKFLQLQQKVDTLKVNVLSLMTDPTIKKFFGPQMSNADVLLMTSSGTTLDALRSNPESLNKELKRLDNLFMRMQSAVANGVGAETGSNIITAPDGAQIQIID